MTDQPLSPDERDFLVFKGWLYLRHDSVERALALFEALGRLFAGDPAILKMLAWTRLRADDAAGALAAADAYLDALGPLERNRAEHAPIHLIRGRALLRLERPDDAAHAAAAYLSLRTVAQP